LQEQEQEFVCGQISVLGLIAEDWQTLRDLRLQALSDSPESFLGDLPAEQAYDEKQWRSELDLNIWFVARLDTRPVGLVKLNRNLDSDEGMHLESMWVAPTIRRRGIGATLVSALESTAATMDARQLRLWVFADNHSARDFYLRLGYTGPIRSQSIEANGRATFEEEYEKGSSQLRV
jgi:GNAT superfamily N-acetyltransferase